MAARIFVVEDELIIALGVERRLRSLGYELAGSAATGEEAVRRVPEVRPDLVLMDIHLGSGMDGVAAAEEVRRGADVPVVFLTAHSDDATLQRAKLAEPHGYVLKPYEDRDLHTAIEVGLFRHQATRRLRENERWLAATLGSIGDGVIATDEQGCVRYMNPLAERLTGWPLAEAVGRDVREVFRIVGTRTRETVLNPALDALARGEPVTLAPDTTLIGRNGEERPIDDSAAPILGLDGRCSGAVLVFRDVTERCRLEDSLRQAHRLEAVGLLAGGIAHDFNNLLTVINGFGQMLLADRLTDADRREYARNVLEAGRRAAALTQQITAFSRKQILAPVVLNLNAVLRDLSPMVRQLVGEGVEVVTALAADLGTTRADPTQVEQVVLNLAANARDAMPGGGRLTLATENVEFANGAADRPPDVPAGRYVRLAVTDTGCGMSPEVLAKVFEPFFTTKGVGQGTGLGLAMVYGIVKQSGGHVEVSSRLGEGTTVRVDLPRLDEPPAPRGGPEVPPAKRGHETVLLVEDEEAVRRLTATVLRQKGYTVLEAADGVAGLDVVNRHAGPIELLVTDMVMPRMSGRELAERAAAARPRIRVLYMSGYTEDTVVRRGVGSASIDLLQKPFDFTSLTRKVREILDRE